MAKKTPASPEKTPEAKRVKVVEEVEKKPEPPSVEFVDLTEKPEVSEKRENSAEKLKETKDVVQKLRGYEYDVLRREYPQDFISRAKRWLNTTTAGKFVKVSAKILGGTAAVMTVGALTGGAGLWAAPLLYSLGTKEIIDGAIEAVQYVGAGERSLRLKIAANECEYRRLVGDITDPENPNIENDKENLKRLVSEIKRQEAEFTAKETKNRKIRTVLSTVATIGVGVLGGIPFGLQNFDADAVSHQVKLTTRGFEFLYNHADKMGDATVNHLIGFNMNQGIHSVATHALGKVTDLNLYGGLGVMAVGMAGRVASQFRNEDPKDIRVSGEKRDLIDGMYTDRTELGGGPENPPIPPENPLVAPQIRVSTDESAFPEPELEPISPEEEKKLKEIQKIILEKAPEKKWAINDSLLTEGLLLSVSSLLFKIDDEEKVFEVFENTYGNEKIKELLKKKGIESERVNKNTIRKEIIRACNENNGDLQKYYDSEEKILEACQVIFKDDPENLNKLGGMGDTEGEKLTFEQIMDRVRSTVLPELKGDEWNLEDDFLTDEILRRVVGKIEEQKVDTNNHQEVLKKFGEVYGEKRAELFLINKLGEGLYKKIKSRRLIDGTKYKAFREVRKKLRGLFLSDKAKDKTWQSFIDNDEKMIEACYQFFDKEANLPEKVKKEVLEKIYS